MKQHDSTKRRFKLPRLWQNLAWLSGFTFLFDLPFGPSGPFGPKSRPVLQTDRAPFSAMSCSHRRSSRRNRQVWCFGCSEHHSVPRGVGYPKASSWSLTSTNLVSFSSHFWRRYWTYGTRKLATCDSWVGFSRHKTCRLAVYHSWKFNHLWTMLPEFSHSKYLNMWIFSCPVRQSEWYESKHVASLDDLDPHSSLSWFNRWLSFFLNVFLLVFIMVCHNWTIHILGPISFALHPSPPLTCWIPPRLDSAPCDVRNPRRGAERSRRLNTGDGPAETGYRWIPTKFVLCSWL